jgi:hypothetical protein
MSSIVQAGGRPEANPPGGRMEFGAISAGNGEIGGMQVLSKPDGSAHTPQARAFCGIGLEGTK